MKYRTIQETWRQEIGPQLRQIRLNKRQTISFVAEQLKFPVDWIDIIECGRKLSFKKYYRLVQYYDKKIHIQLTD